MTEQYKRKPNTHCFVCDKPIYKRPSEIEKTKNKLFCSVACYGISCRKENMCIVCGKPILASLHKKTCSRSCANKNRTGIKYRGDNQNNKYTSQNSLKLLLIQLRGGVCERCGFSRVNILQVHHKNRNRTDNSMKNLELLCPNCHCEEHYA